MALKIIIDPGQRRNAIRKAALSGVSQVELMGWIQEVEFDLQDAPIEKLRYVSGRGTYERRMKQKTDTASFFVVWEFEWDRGANELHLIEFSLV